MKTSVSRTASGYRVTADEGWGKFDSGYPCGWGNVLATGFATAEEAFAWAAKYEAKSQEEG